MKNTVKRIFAIVLSLAVIMSAGIISSANTEREATVIFTHDLHSHLLPSTDDDGNEYGGYARLMTLINEQKQKYPDALLVDGGDFAMGSLFQTAYTTSAIELRMMAEMGYDVTTFGNHEFDYMPSGLAQMLKVAAHSGQPVPQIVISNYSPAPKGDKNYSEELQIAMEEYGVKEYTIIERGGIYYVVFGIFGIDADDCAPNSGFVLSDAAASAQETVDKAVAEVKKTYGEEPVVICLSHSGTEDGEGEDFELAQAVKGIDIIVSGHTHSVTNKPIVVGNTYVVSAGEYGKNLGSLTLKIGADGKASLKEFSLLETSGEVKKDERISNLVDAFKKNVEDDYLSKYSVTFDEVVVSNDYKFETVKDVYATQHESTLGNVFSDAYKWAVEQTVGDEVDVALTAAGVIRESLPTGDVTVSDVFNAASLGVGTEGELVLVYITGKDLKTALEVDASVQPLMSAAQLFFSGIEYSFNTNRMIFNKVDYSAFRTNDGKIEVIDDDKLYSVVTGMYCGQMLGSVEETSMGLLSITPLDKDGNPIAPEELVNFVVKDEEGTPLKEWYAIVSYLKNMEGKMDAAYSKPDGRKLVYSSLNPVDLLKNANKFTYIVIAVIVVLIAAAVLIILGIIRKKRKAKRHKA